jgi:uncharacterized membrane-anchored protein YhcB (DUF1043 family)
MFAVANRAPVLIGLDPFGAQPPMFAFISPLYLALMAALILGVVVGGVAAWMSQSPKRRRARRLAAELKAARAEAEVLRRQLETSAAVQAEKRTAIAAIAYRHPSAA